MASDAREDGRTGPQDLLAYERRFWGLGMETVAGVDEAGRGPLAGPVVAAAVILVPGECIDGATDSKELEREEREALAREVRERARACAVGSASVREIERLNIRGGTILAMERALQGLGRRIGGAPPEQVVVDGPPLPELSCRHEGVVGGDGSVHSVGCASILAKVVRDHLMTRLARRYPGYGWERNVGYPTPEHLEALRELGPTPHHRRTFRGVQLDLGLETGE